MPFRGQAGVVGRLTEVISQPTGLVGAATELVSEGTGFLGTPTALVGEPPEFVGTLTALVGEGTGSGHLLAENKKPLSRVSFELE